MHSLHIWFGCYSDCFVTDSAFMAIGSSTIDTSMVSVAPESQRS